MGNFLAHWVTNSLSKRALLCAIRHVLQLLLLLWRNSKKPSPSLLMCYNSHTKSFLVIHWLNKSLFDSRSIFWMTHFLSHHACYIPRPSHSRWFVPSKMCTTFEAPHYFNKTKDKSQSHLDRELEAMWYSNSTNLLHGTFDITSIIKSKLDAWHRTPQRAATLKCIRKWRHLLHRPISGKCKGDGAWS